MQGQVAGGCTLGAAPFVGPKQQGVSCCAISLCSVHGCLFSPTPAVLAAAAPATACCAVPLEGSCVCGRIVPLVPGKTCFKGLLYSRYGTSEKDITDMVNNVSGAPGWVRGPATCCLPAPTAL